MISVADYGALGDGADQTAALQAAEDAVATKGGILYWPGGDYAVTNITKRAGVSWLAAPSAVLRPVVGSTAALAGCLVVDRFSIRGLTFDLRSTLGLSTALDMTLCSEFAIEGCRFLGIDQYGIVANQPVDFAITGNRFVKNVAEGGRQNEAILVTEVSGGGLRGLVSSNRISGCGTLLCGRKIIIADNVIEDWKYGSGVTVGGTGCADLTIRDNVISGGSGTDVNNTVVMGIENWSPDTIITGNRVSGCAGDGIYTAGPRGVVVGNVSINNGQLATFAGAGIACGGSAGIHPDGTLVADNICTDTQATKTQAYGYIERYASSGITLRGNKLEGNKTGAMLLQSTKLDFAGPQVWGSVADGSHNISNGGAVTGSLTVTGAALGDFVTLSHSQALKGVKFFGWVSAANAVSWRMENETGSSQTISAGTIRAACQKPTGYAGY